MRESLVKNWQKQKTKKKLFSSLILSWCFLNSHLILKLLSISNEVSQSGITNQFISKKLKVTFLKPTLLTKWIFSSILSKTLIIG